MDGVPEETSFFTKASISSSNPGQEGSLMASILKLHCCFVDTFFTDSLLLSDGDTFLNYKEIMINSLPSWKVAHLIGWMDSLASYVLVC